MLSLKDFHHLPDIDPIFDQIIQAGSGISIIAGMNPRTYSQPGDRDNFVPSGKSGIFRILIREILEEIPRLKATIITKDKKEFRVPRTLYGRVNYVLVNSPEDYQQVIPSIVHQSPGLLVVDKLIPENAASMIGCAEKGCWILTQMDTVFRGPEVIRALLDWGVDSEELAGINWIFSLARIPLLCDCKIKKPPEKTLADSFQRRYPFLNINRELEYFGTGGCELCGQSGRRNEVTAFDAYKNIEESNIDNHYSFPIEAYMLRLAELGLIPLDDILRFDSDLLHRTYQNLADSEDSLISAKNTLERKIVELQASNRVLHNRTEELISLHDIGQALTGSTTLRDLAKRVCQQASILCGADRAILYFHRDGNIAEVLATHGWAPGYIPYRVPIQDLLTPDVQDSPSIYKDPPPGIDLNKAAIEIGKLRTGLRISLNVQSEPVGAMIVHSTVKTQFQEGAIALLQTFANQAAVAIQRAGLIENLHEKIDQLEAAQVGLAQKERLERELELAREVQQAVLPHTFPEVPGFDFAAKNTPARQVGGDLYDVIKLGDSKFGLLIGDVSDKGMPAAVYMALTRSLILAEARRSESPAAILKNVNDLLLELGQARMFVSIFYGIIDNKSMTLTFSRAGHDRPIIQRGSDFIELGGDGVVLGVHDSNNLHLSEEKIELVHGDRIILYTDGLVDARSPGGHQFTRKGLSTTLENLIKSTLDSVCDTVFNTILKHQGSAEQFDDMTMLVVEIE